ncbi:MAG: STAS domain-containing protein [Rhodocyclaceae bacterium]|nr:STAS domain-containing protein [Rhodocyclaceae bacterium]
MQSTLRVEGSTGMLRLSGRLEWDSVSQFNRAAAAALGNPGIREVVIDFSEVEFVDSVAMGGLLSYRERCEKAGKTLRLSNYSAPVRRALVTANLHKLFRLD